MDKVELAKGTNKQEFSVEHAQNILNHPINKKVKEAWKLPKDSDWKMDKEKLVKKKK